MTKSGDYNLDFNSDRVIVDGHEFVPTRYQGIYKSIDNYEVVAGEWAEDERNKDVSFFGYRKIGKLKYKVLYAYRYDNQYQNELRNCDEVINCNPNQDEFLFAICIYNSSFDCGFIRGELNI